MKNEKRPACRQAGFTMVELLVVIAIIGLLSAFLVPNLLGGRDRAKQTAVKGVLHTTQLAVEAYEMENLVYPLEKSTALESLAKKYLIPGGYLASVPRNPFTGEEYKDSDKAGKIIYSYDDKTGRYTLKAYSRSGLRVIQEVTNI